MFVSIGIELERKLYIRLPAAVVKTNDFDLFFFFFYFLRRIYFHLFDNNKKKFIQYPKQKKKQILSDLPFSASSIQLSEQEKSLKIFKRFTTNQNRRERKKII